MTYCLQGFSFATEVYISKVKEYILHLDALNKNIPMGSYYLNF